MKTNITTKKTSQLIIDKSTELICRFNSNGELLFVNDRFCHFFDKDQQQLIGKNFYSLLPENERQKIQHKLLSIQPQHPVITFQNSVLKSNGDIIWLQWTNQAIFGNNNIQEFFAVARDISESTLEKNARQLERDNFINILNSMQDGVYIVNQEHDIEFINHALKEAFGPIKGRKCYEYFHDKKNVCKWCKNKEVFSGKTVRWEWFSDKSKKFYDLIDTPLRKPDGSVSKLEIFRDISLLKEAETILKGNKADLEGLIKERTQKLEFANEQLKTEIIERKNTEKLLVQSKNTLQMVFDGISEPLVMLNNNFTIQMLNEAAKQYFNFGNRDDFQNKRCFKAFRGLSKPCRGCKIPSAVKRKDRLSLERKGFMSSKNIEQITIYPLKASDKNSGILLRINDVTESRIIQKRLMQSEKLASLGLLISGIAHEINNPNNFIILNIPTLRKYLDSMIPIIDAYAKENTDFEIQGMSYDEFSEEIYSIIDDIAYGSERINSSIARLKEYVQSRNDRIKQWIDITEIIRKSVSICESQIKKKTKNFNSQIPEGLPKVYTDPNAVEQVLINLLINAAQASDKKDAWITLNARITSKENKCIEISVIDNGCGMDKNTKDKVFDPFFTTKPSEFGTGLGLYITYNMVEKLNGHITVESEKGKGSCFTVSLPIK
ncbi:protein containing ATP-binding region, ATPase-like protein [Candidatus Magnetomorum sp. HK-1]|nr:protein containing ATP-binding region, ATPase-like protein [Candidatus Magnetomorum sp. HK-1]